MKTKFVIAESPTQYRIYIDQFIKVYPGVMFGTTVDNMSLNLKKTLEYMGDKQFVKDLFMLLLLPQTNTGENNGTS